jgi:hypothetical protein
MRKYPVPSDYQAAIQNPNLVLREPELRAARVRLDRLGMPVVSSGGFALSFYLEAPEAPLGEQWVVRCFKADSPDRRARYDAISRFLNANADPMLLDVDYHEQGILVDGAWYPIVKMPLVQGVTLQRYIETEIANGRSLAHLSAKFRAVVSRLEQLGIAHGDLQHGNIMVQAGELVLVDYDGMYVPELYGWPAAEMGSVAYQHPLRRGQFAPDLDRFSAIIIDVALQALAFTPGLWPKYNTGENLLFRQADLTRPQASALLRDLEQIPHLHAAIQQLPTICRAPFEATPRLADVVASLPADVQPVLLPGTQPAVKSPFVWQPDVDEQLHRLYANWTPTTAATNAAPVPVAVPLPVVTGALAGPLPVQGAPHHAPQHTPQHAPASHRPHRARARSRGEVWLPWKRLVKIGMVLAVIAAGRFHDSLTAPVFMAPVASQAVAARGPGVYVTEKKVSPASLVPSCPPNLTVQLHAPRGGVDTDLVRFDWRADQVLAAPCRFRVRLWRVGGTEIDVADNYLVTQDGGAYHTDLYLPQLLPADARTGGTFHWTVELVDDPAADTALPTYGAPREFNWAPSVQ